MDSKHNNNKPNFKTFWEGIDDPGHRSKFDTSDWYEKYAGEMIPYFSNTDVVVDCGCGSGEMMAYSSKHVKELIGVDFSETMLKKARGVLDESKCNNVELIQANFTHIDQYLKKKVNVISNNSVLQYLHFDESLLFLKNAKKHLAEEGEIVFFNVPNIKYIDLYALRVFHLEDKVEPLKLLKKYISLSKDIFKERIKNKKYTFDGGLGYWYSENDFIELAELAGYNVEIYSPKFLHYAYRMHVKFTPK
jgi:ubiquinone/menaquinone biosynthesis C-methylase UbiE